MPAEPVETLHFDREAGSIGCSDYHTGSRCVPTPAKPHTGGSHREQFKVEHRASNSDVYQSQVKPELNEGCGVNWVVTNFAA